MTWQIVGHGLWFGFTLFALGMTVIAFTIGVASLVMAHLSPIRSVRWRDHARAAALFVVGGSLLHHVITAWPPR